jgi:high affinity sulfate transporter 1
VSRLTDRLSRFLPGVETARSYRLSWLRHDLAAGATLTALLIPAGMGYAQAAGLPPVTGLYATIVPLLIYAAVGPSRVLILAPDSALAPMIAAAILPLAAGGSDRAVALAGLLAIIVGAILVAGRFLRLGFVTGLLSKPIRVGYLNGLALIVMVSQLPDLLGLSIDKASLWQDVGSIAAAAGRGETNLAALGLGTASLLLIFVPKWLGWRVPGVLLAVAGSILAAAVFGLGGMVEVVGGLPQGLPGPALGGLGWGDVAALLGPAVGIALIAFADTAVLSRTLAARRGENVDGNQEMGALGAANVATGLFSGFPVCSSSSRTPVAIDAGARTQLVGVVGAVLLIAFMYLAPGVMEFLPAATLAAVVISAAISLLDLKTLAALARMSRIETALLLAAFLGVAFVGVLEGIVIAIGLSLLAFVYRAWNPYRTELVRVEGRPGYHDVTRHPEGMRLPGLVLARFDAPLFFANGAIFGSFVRDLVEEAEEPVRWVVLTAEPITGVDTTALDELVALDDYLARKGIELYFAEMKGPVKDRLIRFGVGSRFGPDHFHSTIGAAVKAYRMEFDLPEEDNW